VTGPARGIALFDGSTGPELAIVKGGGMACAIVWPGTGAHARSLHHLWLEVGGRTVQMSHPSEAVYYVIDGEGRVVDLAGGGAQTLRPGSVVHVEPGTPHVVEAGPSGIELVGGPAPADPALYAGLEPRAG
jgi:quercetin dioxygenase-like cupin family protein